MKGLVAFFLKDKHRIPPMSLAEIGFGLLAVLGVAFLLAAVILA